jgi:enamine deaminase RidA (YjgF/YER057c/UK114 family)
MQILLPEGWNRPKGYSNAVVAEGRQIFVAGQIGWNAEEAFVDLSFAGQFRQALENIVAVLKAGGAGPEHVVRTTWFITDKHEYLAQAKEVGAAWRDIMGRHYPAMSVVVVAGLIEDLAKVEIEATAVVPQ